jgi:hypothetical protein
MKLIITPTDNYLLVVDDSEIKSGDYRCNVEWGYIRLVDDDPSYYNKRKDVFKNSGMIPKQESCSTSFPFGKEGESSKILVKGYETVMRNEKKKISKFQKK